MIDERIADSDDAKTPNQARVLSAGARNALGDLGGLRPIGGQLARTLRELFEPLLRTQVKVVADAPRIVRFDDYVETRDGAFPVFASMTMAPLTGHALAVLDGESIFAMLDLFYGGSGQVPSPLPTDFPPSAEAIARRAARGVADRLADAWRDVAALDFTVDKVDTNAAMLAGVDPDERLVLARFSLTELDGRSSIVDILYPVEGLRPLAPQLGSKTRARAGDPGWFGALTRTVMEVRLPVRSVLAEQTVPLSRLMNLQPGDIIPISFGPEVPLFVADNHFARGSVGAANGRAAIRVARLENLPDEDQQ